MANGKNQSVDEVDELLRNAQLRDALEPYFDEAIGRVNVNELSTPEENAFLEQMLAWERAPVLPIAEWFSPPLSLPHPDDFSRTEEGEQRLFDLLWDTINRLFEQRIVLDFTDHLSDRDLYCLIYRDILPSEEKKIDSTGSYLHWDCADTSENQEVWLRYYASDDERQMWSEEQQEDLPPREKPPFPRSLPRRPLDS